MEIKTGEQIEIVSIFGDLIKGTIDFIDQKNVFVKAVDSGSTHVLRKQTLIDQGYLIK